MIVKLFESFKSKPREKTLLEQGLENIFYSLDKKIAEKKRVEERIELTNKEEREILKNILWHEYGVDWKDDVETNNRVTEFIKTKGKKYLPIALVIGLVSDNQTTERNIDDPGKKQVVENMKDNKSNTSADLTTVEYKPVIKENTYELNFDESVYESLPNYGKEIYKFMAENNPTPERGYAILDKKNAIEYVFDPENNLIAKIIPGFGKDEGDEKNTSVELGYDKGTQTTPAGVYLFANPSTQEDIKEYGKNQFSLTGISVIGDSIFLGEHQTYTKHNQLIIRTEKLNTPDPNDNKFSNGCINIDAKDFEKYIKPNFKGDYSEILFILPDAKSEASGVEFNIQSLVKKIMAMVIQMSYQQSANLNKSAATASEANRELIDIALKKLENRRNRAEEVIKKN